MHCARRSFSNRKSRSIWSVTSQSSKRACRDPVTMTRALRSPNLLLDRFGAPQLPGRFNYFTVRRTLRLLVFRHVRDVHPTRRRCGAGRSLWDCRVTVKFARLTGFCKNYSPRTRLIHIAPAWYFWKSRRGTLPGSLQKKPCLAANQRSGGIRPARGTSVFA